MSMTETGLVMKLTPERAKRAVELLDIIVRPGDHEFYNAIEEAQIMLGYDIHKLRPKTTRSFYGIHKPKSK